MVLDFGEPSGEGVRDSKSNRFFIQNPQGGPWEGKQGDHTRRLSDIAGGRVN